MPGDLGDELVGDPVEDADEGGVVFLGGAQEVPGDGVGVAGGGGDHHPDVGGGDEFGGEQAVAGDQGVDVGGVEEGEAAGQGRGGLDAQDGGVGAAGVVVLVEVGAGAAAVVPGGVRDAGEAGQDAAGAEPVVVVGVADQDRGAGGGAQHARFADLPSDQGVDQGGLAGAGGAADDREEGRLGGAEARQQVVVELGEEFVAVDAGSGGAGHG